MHRLLLGLLTMVMGFSSPSLFADGNYLLDRCENALRIAEDPGKFSGRTDMAYCYGLLQGVRELNHLYELKKGDEAYFCLGNTYLGHRESALLVVEFLRSNPKILHKNETALAVQAFRKEYPCN